jgi:hypothetical protein
MSKSKWHQGKEKFGIKDNSSKGRKFLKKIQVKSIRRVIKKFLRKEGTDE